MSEKSDISLNTQKIQYVNQEDFLGQLIKVNDTE